MKTFPLVALSTSLLIAGCSGPQDSGTSAGSPAGMEDMPMPGNPTVDASAAAAPSTDAMAQASKTATAVGTIQSIDTQAGKITLAHGPVAALDWPAMTMAFKASPEQIASVKIGQKVQFEFRAQGMDATITRISPAP
jgi:Cu(I)/Ag(I) efflux system protein CusF